MTAALSVQGLCKSYGGLRVTHAVSMEIQPGERHLLIGPNGAGKTTLFNLIAGDIAADAGEIRLMGQDVTRDTTASRAQAGLARTYQIVTLFERDTLLHNVTLALMARLPLRWRHWGTLGRQTAVTHDALHALEIAGLAGKADIPAGQTSYGEKKRLEIAMALSQRPKVLLLDEPFAGLSAEERTTIYTLLISIDRTVTIIMIEHDMSVALSFADRITLLHYGEVIMAGTRQEVVDDPRTRELYLGS
ncbi:MAG: ABC transporter ATP-binding protein [Candidimonas sp.]|nr:MAG: ABC transporter ATP-binding protein [Candidimonas sp.]